MASSLVPTMCSQPIRTLTTVGGQGHNRERNVERGDGTGGEAGMEEGLGRWWDGGSELSKEGLHEDMVISTVPTSIGEGVRLFAKSGNGDGNDDVLLETVDTRSFPSGLVKTRYRVLKEGGYSS